jgi:hypothetical protein
MYDVRRVFLMIPSRPYWPAIEQMKPTPTYLPAQISLAGASALLRPQLTT